jgi:hypothetical protein
MDFHILPLLRTQIVMADEMASFRAALSSAENIVVLCGAGFSAASGLGVFPRTHTLPPNTDVPRRRRSLANP